jgi:hypothetical protein
MFGSSCVAIDRLSANGRRTGAILHLLALYQMFIRLSKTYEDDKVATNKFLFYPYSTLSKGRDPTMAFHLDDFQDNCYNSQGYVQMNFWIALKEVKGYPISFVKSDSTEQKRDPGNTGLQYFNSNREPDNKNKFLFIPDMKKGQVVVFKGSCCLVGSRQGSFSELLQVFRLPF